MRLIVFIFFFSLLWPYVRIQTSQIYYEVKYLIFFFEKKKHFLDLNSIWKKSLKEQVQLGGKGYH